MESASTAERIRRAEYMRDSKAALARGEPFELRGKQREQFAAEWAAWFKQRMDRVGCDDPTELLPDALARLQQLIDDRIAVAINEIKTKLQGALK
jgi:hypothetical protein